MPAFAPVDKPLLLVAAALLVGGKLVRVGWAVGEVGRVVGKDVVVVEKSERSACWYSTRIGCAHMVSGPVTAVVPRLESATRSTSSVGPEAGGYVLRQPSKSKESVSREPIVVEEVKLLSGLD